jgi:hypothetical protein
MDTALSPGFARMTYDGASGVHHMITPLNIVLPATPGLEPDITPKGGVATGAEAALTGFYTALLEFFGSDQDLGLVEIYTVDDTTGEGTFIYGFNLGLTGTNGGASVKYRQASLTTKLTNGKTGRLLVMDSPLTLNLNIFAPFAPGTPEREIADYLISADSVFYGRGNAYPFSPLRLLTKDNDALRARGGL